MSISLGLNRLCFMLNNCNIKKSLLKSVNGNRLPAVVSRFDVSENKKFHTSCIKNDLMEFFDDKENWGAQEVQVGRSWKVEELRIKSNSDLHKLWYVLLKERNMLLTMEHEYNKKYISMPNPERIDKVEESMENLETVVRERNKAYYELETGETGERPVRNAINCFGLPFKHKLKQYSIEKRFNTKYLAYERMYVYTNDHEYVNDFLRKLDEKKRLRTLSKRKRQHHIVCGLLKRFPNMDEEALKNEFPNVDIEAAKRDKRSRGHRENLY